MSFTLESVSLSYFTIQITKKHRAVMYYGEPSYLRRELVSWQHASRGLRIVFKVIIASMTHVEKWRIKKRELKRPPEYATSSKRHDAPENISSARLLLDIFCIQGDSLTWLMPALNSRSKSNTIRLSFSGKSLQRRFTQTKIDLLIARFDQTGKVLENNSTQDKL